MPASLHTLQPATCTIRRADLPAMRHVPIPELDALDLPVKFYFDMPRENRDEFDTLMVVWDDGFALYFGRRAVEALQRCAERGFNVEDILRVMRGSPDDFKSVYRVID